MGSEMGLLVATVTLGRWQEPIEVSLNNQPRGYFWGEIYINNEGKKVADPRSAKLSLQVKYFRGSRRVFVGLFHTPQSQPICSGTVMLRISEEHQVKFKAWFSDQFVPFSFEEQAIRQPVSVTVVLRRESEVTASASS